MKITITIITVVSARGFRYEKKEIECKGEGTESDPAIIEPSENLPGAFTLEESNLFITIQNCYLGRLLVNSCENVRIENCNIWSLSIQYCSKAFVSTTTIRRTLSLWESNNVKIENSTINRLKIRLSNSNIIKDSSVKVVKFITGRDNILEANKIPEKHLKKLKKKYWYDWYKLKIT